MNVSTLTNCIQLGCVLFFLSGCQLPYLATGAVEQIRILNSRKKIDNVIKSVAAKDIKSKLIYSKKARQFALDSGLNCENNFTTYVDLERPYVSYLLIASKKTELKAKTWYFPIVGSFPYKGYFSKDKALKAAKNLEQKNYDTYVRGVTAYSSLGWFDEPILSSMMAYSKEDLASTLFHECFHSTFFIKNNVDINEQLATFFAHHLLLKFLQSENNDSAALKQKKSWEEEKKLSLFLQSTLSLAEKFYADSNSDSKESPNREILFTRVQEDYKSKLKPYIEVNNYDSVFLENLNNAKLVAFKTYFYNFKSLEDTLEKNHANDILSFLNYLKDLNKKEKKDFTQSL